MDKNGKVVYPHTGGRITSQGKLAAFAGGGLVPGIGNKDTVPALLTPGELVLTEKQYSFLDKMLENARLLSNVLTGNSFGSLAVQPVGSTQINQPTTINNSPRIEVNIGMYAGTEIEKRKIAQDLNKALSDSNKIKGIE